MHLWNGYGGLGRYISTVECECRVEEESGVLLPHGGQFNLGLLVQHGPGETSWHREPDNPTFQGGLELDKETDIESAVLARPEDGARVPAPEGRGKTALFAVVKGVEPSSALPVVLVELHDGPHVVVGRQ